MVSESTSPYADVRLQYYLVCAWYFALIRGDAEHAAAFIKKALKLSDVITPTDMQKIENLIIPCTNIYYELQDYDQAMALLYEGTRLCKCHVNTDSYARLKKDLCDHLLEVGIAAQRFEYCRKFIELIELENEEIVDPENRVEIPDGIREVIESGKL
jgi:tetratricopeptide (TPR) repeat protein